jgi:hypothetical protein
LAIASIAVTTGKPGSRMASAGRIGRRRRGSLRVVGVIGWLLDGDPAIRWQVLRDLANAPSGEVAAERARVEHDGWGARLLALEDRRADPRRTAC